MCGRRGYYEKILGYTSNYKAESLQKGELVHYMLQEYYTEKIKPEFDHDAVVKLVLEKGAEYAVRDDFTLTSEEIAFERDIFQRYCNYYRGELWKPLHVEVPFSKVLYSQPDDGDNEGITVLYEGKVDLIVDPNGSGEEILIIDHKTFSRSGPVSSLSNQFMGYAWAFKTKNVGVNRIGLQLSGSDEKRFQRSLASYYQSRIDEWKYWATYTTLEFIRNHDIGVYPPNLTSCDKFNGCTFRSVCSSDPQIRDWKLQTQFRKRDHDLYTEEKNDEEAHA
jgi:hypothetical protein